MPSVLNGLAGAYNAWVDWKPLREALRQRRSALGLTLDQVETASKINRATIHSIENVKKEPDLQSKLQTLERYAEVLGMRLSVELRPVEHEIAQKRPLDTGQMTYPSSPIVHTLPANPTIGGDDDAQAAGLYDLIRDASPSNSALYQALLRQLRADLAHEHTAAPRLDPVDTTEPPRAHEPTKRRRRA